MTNNELLLSISDMMDAKLLPIEKHIDNFDHKLDRVEENLMGEIKRLDLKIDNVEERLNTKINNVEASLNARINDVEVSLNARINDVEKGLTTEINRVEQTLKGQIQLINLKLENIIEPRLNEIESCYVSTSERYQATIEKFQSHEIDLSVIKSVIQEHSRKLEQCTA